MVHLTKKYISSIRYFIVIRKKLWRGGGNTGNRKVTEKMDEYWANQVID